MNSSSARVAATGLMLLGLAGTAALANAASGADARTDAGPSASAPIPAPSAPSPVDFSTGAPSVTDTPAAQARTGADVSYDWPIPPGDVTRAFDRPDAPWLSGHRGVDLAGSAGDRVLAAADGVVAFAGMVAGKGVISIEHADGIRTTYEPVIGSLEAGTQVHKGEVIGTLTLGHGLTPALHWGARVGRDYLDPVTLIDAPVVIRLYPDRALNPGAVGAG